MLLPLSYIPKYNPLYTKIPNKQLLNPLYTPKTPSFLYTLDIQSNNPLNYLFSEPISTANIVLAKSNGYTKHTVIQPAKPPAKILFNINYVWDLFLASYTFTN